MVINQLLSGHSGMMLQGAPRYSNSLLQVAPGEEVTIFEKTRSTQVLQRQRRRHWENMKSHQHGSKCLLYPFWVTTCICVNK